jgi:hypothetical protein
MKNKKECAILLIKPTQQTKIKIFLLNNFQYKKRKRVNFGKDMLKCTVNISKTRSQFGEDLK